MKKKLLHTPEGVRDIYGSECRKKLILEERLHDVLRLYGYSDIQTPSYEFFDIFNKERGSVPSNEMFKFFDRNGNTMVLRPDMTPAIARTAAKYFDESVIPVKLCYKGNTYINNSSYQGRLKETTQIGAELIGDSSLQADAEIIAMVVECLLNAGLTEFQVEVGNVAYFKGILKEAGIDGETQEEVIELIRNKNYFGVEGILESTHVTPELANTLLSLPQLFGSVEVLDKALESVENEQSKEAIKRLHDLYDLLVMYGYEKYVTFDLGMLSRHDYYTGVIFNAYTYGTGESLVKGGRYDKLIGQFGRERASIGFTLTLEQLMIALSRQKIDIPLDDCGAIVLYEKKLTETAVGLAKKIRMDGSNASLILDEDKSVDISYYINYAKDNNIGKIYYVTSADSYDVRDVRTGTLTERTI